MADLSYVPFEEFERVRNLDVDPVTRTSLFAALCRVNTLYMIKYAGSGHIGTSFSCIDIVSWLFLNEMRNPGAVDGEGPQDIYFSSKGHDAPGLYSILIGQGLMDFSMIHRLRNLGGLPGHPDVHVPYMHVNSGSLGMGISKAKGMITANRLQGVDQNIYVLTGDGELQEGQLWESLGSAVRSDMGELTVIVDHNKVQSDLLVSDTSALGDLEAKFSAFGWRVARCDGNDLNSLADALAGVKDAPAQPKIIIADTLKGAGVSFMEHTAMQPEDERYMFHSGAPSDDGYASASTELLEKANALLTEVGTGELNTAHGESQTAPTPQSPQRLVDAYSSALLDPGTLFPVWNCRARHGVSGRRNGAERTNPSCTLLRLLPVRSTQRADLYKRHRGYQDHLHVGAGRVNSRRHRTFPSERAGHIRSGCGSRYVADTALHRCRG